MKQSILDNAKKHRPRRFVLNFDLKDLFPTFNFGRVRGFSSKAVTSVLMKSLAECARVFDEDGDIVIRIGPVIAPRAP